MKTNDVINAFINMMGISEKNYSGNFFHLPRIYCNDGFNISVQVNEGNYCSSENGYREFGTQWKTVEWGFPSENIDANIYNAEGGWDDEVVDTTDSVGSVEIEKIDDLLESHDGIDILATLSNAKDWMDTEVRYNSRTRLSTTY